MIFLIAGILLSAFSLIVLGMMIRGLWNAQRTLEAHGINKPLPLPLKARAVIWAWMGALIAGIAMIAVHYI